jgi:hypothetical protein
MVEFRSDLTRQGIAKGTVARIVGVDRDRCGSMPMASG